MPEAKMIPATVIDPGAKSFLTALLSHACPSDAEPDAEGFRNYWIETHCVGFRVRAKNTDPLGWVVASFTAEDC